MFSRFCQLLSDIASDCPSVPWGSATIVNIVNIINIANIVNIGSQEISRYLKEFWIYHQIGNSTNSEDLQKMSRVKIYRIY